MRNKNYFAIFMFLLPTFILFFLIFAVPLGTVVGSSFTNWRMNKPIEFIGLKNYIDLFTDDRQFKAALTNTLMWIFLQCTIYVGIGTLVALLTANNTRVSKLIKIVYLIPNVIATSALAMLCFYVFHPQIGIINALIRGIGFKDFNKNWYFEYDTAFFTVTLSIVFFAGIICLLISAQIASIPVSIFEAAKIDGATGIKTTFFVTLPLIKNMIATAIILAATYALKTFDVIFLTTGGGPGTKTINLSVYLYNIQMRTDRFGYGNTVGTILLVLGIAAILIVNFIFKEREKV